MVPQPEKVFTATDVDLHLWLCGFGARLRTPQAFAFRTLLLRPTTVHGSQRRYRMTGSLPESENVLSPGTPTYSQS